MCLSLFSRLPPASGRPRRPGFSFLELQVAFVLFSLALAGLYPLVIMQSKQTKKMEAWLSPTTTYYLVPSSDEWARKLGAVAMRQTQDPGPRPTPPMLVLDNGENGYSEFGTGWGAETQKKAYKQTLRWNTAGLGLNTATWRFANLTPGLYDVQVTWVEGANRATNAPYQIFTGTAPVGSLDGLPWELLSPVLVGTYTVNQTKAPSGSTYGGSTWQSLAIVSISTGAAKVVLSDNANGRVIADAVRLVPVFNIVSIVSLDKTMTSEDMTAHVTVTKVQ